MKVVPPVLCEMLCDWGRSSWTAEESMRLVAEYAQQFGEQFMLDHPYYPGCGIRFQWYWGMPPHCPECGRAYLVKIDDFKAGKYNPTTI